MSWVRPACSGVSSGDGALTVPFLAIDLGFCESPLLCFHPSLGDSFDPWLKSEGFRCSGVACFVLAIGVFGSANRDVWKLMWMILAIPKT